MKQQHECRFVARMVSAALIAGASSAFIPHAAYAAPSISSLGSTVTNGQSLTISGSGFGTGDAAPLLWDNFENGTAGAALNSAPQVGTWQPDNRPAPRYTDAKPYSGSKSSYAAFKTGGEWSNLLVAIKPMDRLYQSFAFWWSSTGTQGQLKLMQIHGSDDVGDYAPGLMTGSSTTTWWTSYISTENGRNDLNTRSDYPSDPGPGQWHQFQMWLQRSSAGGAADGQVNIAVDGKIVYQKNNAVTRDNSADNWKETSFFHGVTNMGGSTDVYLDDVYLNDSWARVVLSDSATFSGIKKFAVQPAKQWSDGSISVQVDKGGFASLGGLFLYVVDANGNANSSGYALSGAQTVAAPRPPTNVTVQ